MSSFTYTKFYYVPLQKIVFTLDFPTKFHADYYAVITFRPYENGEVIKGDIANHYVSQKEAYELFGDEFEEKGIDGCKLEVNYHKEESLAWIKKTLQKVKEWELYK